MGLFDKRIAYKPFEYPEVMKFVESINKSFWVHSEVDFTADVQDFKTNLSDKEKEVVKRSLLGIAQVEVGVKTFWGDLYKHFPKPEINGLGATFSENEFRHSEAYSQLLEVLGYNEEFEELVNTPVIQRKIEYINHNLSNSDIVSKLLFFTIVIENVSLFSQFADILSFTRFKGYMKNISNIIAWTSIDEQCFPLNTEVLTPLGWKLISDMKLGDKVYGFKEGNLQEEEVIKTIRKSFKGNLITIGNKRHSISTTPNHEFIYKKSSDWLKSTAENLKLNNHMQIPVTSNFKSNSTLKLSDLDRLKIAIQADGTQLYWNNEGGDKLPRGKEGGNNYSIALYKERKVLRLRNILESLGVEFSETEIFNNSKKGTCFRFHLDYLSDYKNLDWIYKYELSKEFCEEFIQEVLLWDGHVSNTEKCYITTNKSNIKIVEHMAILAGYRTSIYENKDSDRSENYNNCFKINLTNKDSEVVLGNSYNKTNDYFYDQDVVCITVPSGGIIVKQGDKAPFITGNCHANAGIYLINTLQKEGHVINEELFQKQVISYIEEESLLLDWIYEEGELDFFTKEDMLNFMKYRVDESLVNIGMSKIFNITGEQYKPMAWFEEEIFANAQDDFFAKRPTDYTKHDKSITANDLF